MLPTRFRIRTRTEYRRLRKVRGVFRLAGCTVVREKNTLGHFRLGITIRARARSIDRNRTKRCIREVFKQLSVAGVPLGAYDYEVIVPIGKSIAYPFPKRLKQTLTEELPRLCAMS